MIDVQTLGKEGQPFWLSGEASQTSDARLETFAPGGNSTPGGENLALLPAGSRALGKAGDPEKA